MLTEGRHDVLSALESNPRATDKELLALATDEQPIIITEYKDSVSWYLCTGCPTRESFASSKSQ